jgi:hypothetical protein
MKAVPSTNILEKNNRTPEMLFAAYVLDTLIPLFVYICLIDLSFICTIIDDDFPHDYACEVKPVDMHYHQQH